MCLFFSVNVFNWILHENIRFSSQTAFNFEARILFYIVGVCMCVLYYLIYLFFLQSVFLFNVINSYTLF